ncbi:MAG: hypothetical protein K9I34_07165, partial [Bacteroidales bacterium]|nr:hypothetical protein [Bacteroidales bacterium]
MLKRWMILLLLPLQFLAFPLFGNPYLVQFTDSLCSGETGYLTISGNANFQIDSIHFTGTGVTILNDSSISFAPLSTSYYYFIVYSQGFDFEDSIQVVVILPPVASFFLSEDTICSNELVSGVNTSAFWTESQWFAGPALIAQTPGFTQSFSNVGAVPLQVPISLVVSNSIGCSDSLQQVLVVLPGPDPINFDTYPAGYFNNCLEEDSFEVYVFNISATASSNTLYEIDWGNGITQNLSTWPSNTSISSVYTESGMYFIQVIISNSYGCQAQSSHYVFYGSNPSITLGNPGNTTLLCAPRTYYFPLYYTNLQGEENPDGTIYTITFNDGSPDMIFSHPPPDTLVHTFYHSSCGTSAGNYLNAFNIKVLAENPCGSSSSTVEPIVLKNQTDAEFSMSDQGPVCPDDTVVLTQLIDSGNNVNYTGGAYVCDSNIVFNWSIYPSTGWTKLSGELGDSPLNFNTFPFFNSGSPELEVSFQQAGTYIITLSSDNSCNPQSTFVDTIVVLEAPVMDISVFPVIGCAPLTVQTTNNSQGDGMQHNWSVSPGNGVSFISGNSSSLSPTFLFTQAGNFTIEYTMLNTCRELDTLIGIQVQAAPDVLGLTPLHVCVEDTLVTFVDYEDNYALINSYAWSISPTSNYSLVNSSLNQANLQLTFSVPGTYQLLSHATNVCGTDSFVTQAIVEALPVFNLLADSILCMGEQSTISVQFVNPPSYASFQWSTGQTGNSISLQPYDNQVVGLVITSAAQCVYSRNILFTVHPLPVVSAGLNQSYCLDAANDTLIGLPAGGSWSVVSGASGVSAAGVLQASVLGVGIENLVYTWQDTTTSCSNSDQMQVTIYDLPVVNAGADSLFCNQPIVATLQGFTPSDGIWSGPNLTNVNTGSFIPNGVDTI